MSREGEIRGYAESFWSKVHPNGDCWEWQGYRNTEGYGRYQHRSMKRPVNAHRIAYELLIENIPTGKQLDHLCRNRACVNPDHLEPVTLKENVLRGEGVTARNARKTHCDNGHEFTLDNTMLEKSWRRCRECRREAVRQWRRRQRELRLAA